MSFLKQADLFSRPFQFSIGERSTNKRTVFGGGLSLSIIGVSIVYLSYLLDMYFSNKYLPKVTKELILASEDNSQSMSESLFKFKMIMSGKPLQVFEAN